MDKNKYQTQKTFLLINQEIDFNPITNILPLPGLILASGEF